MHYRSAQVLVHLANGMQERSVKNFWTKEFGHKLFSRLSFSHKQELLHYDAEEEEELAELSILKESNEVSERMFFYHLSLETHKRKICAHMLCLPPLDGLQTLRSALDRSHDTQQLTVVSELLVHSQNPDLSLVGMLTDHITHLKSHLASLGIENRESLRAMKRLSMKLGVSVSRRIVVFDTLMKTRKRSMFGRWADRTRLYVHVEFRLKILLRKCALRRGFSRISQLSFRTKSMRIIRHLHQWHSLARHRKSSRRVIELWVAIAMERSENVAMKMWRRWVWYGRMYHKKVAAEATSRCNRALKHRDRFEQLKVLHAMDARARGSKTVRRLVCRKHLQRLSLAVNCWRLRAQRHAHVLIAAQTVRIAKSTDYRGIKLAAAKLFHPGVWR